MAPPPPPTPSTSTTRTSSPKSPGPFELSAEQFWGRRPRRCSPVTLFAESTRDSLYSQTLFDAAANRNISRVQNVDRIGTTGLETSLTANDLWGQGLDVSGSPTYTDSKIKRNAGFRHGGRHRRQVAAQHCPLARHPAGQYRVSAA